MQNLVLDIPPQVPEDGDLMNPGFSSTYLITMISFLFS